MKYLSGSELVDYIKNRQAKEVRSLIQSRGVQPKLAIIVTVDDPVIETYMRLKQSYAEDIGVEIEVMRVSIDELADQINGVNQDPSFQGIILQLPLAKPEVTDEMINLLDPTKDVDGLMDSSEFDPATPMAILWLLSGYGIDLGGKDVAVIGQGRLVGASLSRMLEESGLNVTRVDEADDLVASISNADVVIAATGSAGLIKPDMLKLGSVVVDAGTSSESGIIKGDLDPEVYERDDLAVTPKRGGVGPLTIAALMDNLLRAARKSTNKT